MSLTINLLILLSISAFLSVECKNMSHWDVIVLVRHWLPTNCKAHVTLGFTHACRMPIQTESWAIHGVWPTNFHSVSPEFCQHPAKFLLEDLAPLQRDLNETWPDILQVDTMGPTFWAYEWSKHGTCLDLPTWSPVKYFQLGVELHRKYDLKAALNKAQIAPSNNFSYELERFVKAIQVSLGTKPRVKCFIHEQNQYILEINLCFTKELKIVDCNYRDDLCDPNMGIIYPTKNITM